MSKPWPCSSVGSFNARGQREPTLSPLVQIGAQLSAQIGIWSGLNDGSWRTGIEAGSTGQKKKGWRNAGVWRVTSTAPRDLRLQFYQTDWILFVLVALCLFHSCYPFACAHVYIQQTRTRARAHFSFLLSLSLTPSLSSSLGLSLCFSLHAVNPNKGNRIAKPMPTIRSLPESSYERFIRQWNVLLILNSTNSTLSAFSQSMDYFTVYTYSFRQWFYRNSSLLKNISLPENVINVFC